LKPPLNILLLEKIQEGIIPYIDIKGKEGERPWGEEG